MSKNIIYIGIGALGLALFGRLLMGDGDVSTQAKRNYLSSLGDETERNDPVWHLLDENEISIVYAVITEYGNPNDAPLELKQRFQAIGIKYNIFT